MWRGSQHTAKTPTTVKRLLAARNSFFKYLDRLFNFFARSSFSECSNELPDVRFDSLDAFRDKFSHFFVTAISSKTRDVIEESTSDLLRCGGTISRLETES